ncbi:BON domain-containing protein [Thiobaca trueperi]|uniref:Hyperosmotically inducible protein n=1 Tax=Thiobaca trueperi TaxID=127458 RepID=A0A4R3MS06_9GAMM|nr:BON domain-containing protein [Thiobaca trueperi]TCT19148.1 hyperosmotically inducible protein [Thiobaca trueperi]
MTLFHKRLAIVAFPALMLAMAGFAQAATAEDAGKSIDQTVEKTGTTMDEAKESAGERTEKTGSYMDDSAITTKVKAEILGDPMLKVLQIHVTTTDGVVYLSGEVDSQQSIDRAKEVAEGVKHVKSVTSALVVKGAK